MPVLIPAATRALWLIGRSLYLLNGRGQQRAPLQVFKPRQLTQVKPAWGIDANTPPTDARIVDHAAWADQMMAVFKAAVDVAIGTGGAPHRTTYGRDCGPAVEPSQRPALSSKSSSFHGASSSTSASRQILTRAMFLLPRSTPLK